LAQDVSYIGKYGVMDLLFVYLFDALNALLCEASESN